MKTIIIVLAALSLSASMSFAQHRDFHRGVGERHFGGTRVSPRNTDSCLAWNGTTWVNYCNYGFHRVDRGRGFVRRGEHR